MYEFDPSMFPFDHLSVSSIRTYLSCPARWRARYLWKQRDQTNGPMLLGSAAGAAEAQSDFDWMENGEPMSTEGVLDHYSDEFDLRANDEDIAWGKDVPGTLKDRGAAALRVYHETVLPTMANPVAAERHIEIEFDDVPWKFVAYPDVETEDGLIIDRKMTARRFGMGKVRSDIQSTAYLACRAAEGNPASGFEFHTMVRTAKDPVAEAIPVTRTAAQVDRFWGQVYGIAGEIAWRIETDRWHGAPIGAWDCAPSTCGHWDDCEFGGLHARVA